MHRCYECRFRGVRDADANGAPKAESMNSAVMRLSLDFSDNPSETVDGLTRAWIKALFYSREGVFSNRRLQHVFVQAQIRH